MDAQRAIEPWQGSCDALGREIRKVFASPPPGTVLWFHALSIGESNALLPLIETALDQLPEAHVVLTTSTATSVAALEKQRLPDRATHVILPIDTRRAVGRFLVHWARDIAGFAKLGFWPHLMVDTNALFDHAAQRVIEAQSEALVPTSNAIAMRLS